MGSQLRNTKELQEQSTPAKRIANPKLYFVTAGCTNSLCKKIGGRKKGELGRASRCTADEARSRRHMPTGEGEAQQQGEALRVGDVVERDIDGIWFPAKVMHANIE